MSFKVYWNISNRLCYKNKQTSKCLPQVKILKYQISRKQILQIEDLITSFKFLIKYAEYRNMRYWLQRKIWDHLEFSYLEYERKLSFLPGQRKSKRFKPNTHSSRYLQKLDIVLSYPNQLFRYYPQAVVYLDINHQNHTISTLNFSAWT